jgi:hypothetical protein
MGKFLATDVAIIIDGLDVSGHAFSVDLPDSKEQVDVSGFSSTGAKEFLPGNRDQTATIGLLQDFAASQIHSKLNTLYTASSTFVFSVRPTSGATSATNPSFGGTAQLYEYDGLNAALNARAEIQAVLRPANGAVWTWATA